MTTLYTLLFGWMPPTLEAICIGVVVIFFVVAILNIIRFVLDIIPFL